MLITLAKLLFFLYLCLQNLLTSYTKFNVITTLLCLSSILFNIGILCWIISMTIMLMITLNFDIISKFYVVGIKSFKTFVQLEKIKPLTIYFAGGFFVLVGFCRTLHVSTKYCIISPRLVFSMGKR